MQGLNGLIGRWLKKAIVKVASLVDSSLNIATYGVSSEIGSFESWANELGSGNGGFWNRTEYNGISLGVLENDPRGDYEPTLDEEYILDKSLEEIAIVISSITEDAVLIEKSTFSIKLINKLYQRIAVLKSHYYNDQNQGLSLKAIDLRDLIIDVMVLPALKVVETKINQSQLNISTKNSSRTIEAKTLVSELSPVQKISWKKHIAIFQTIGLANFSDGFPIEDNPIDILPVETEPVATETQQTKTTKLSWILYALAGFGIYKTVIKK